MSAKDTNPELPPLPDGKTQEDMIELGKEYAINMCDKALTELLNKIIGTNVFSGLDVCGNVSAEKGGRKWTFNYEVVDKEHRYEAPKELQGPNNIRGNDDVLTGIMQLIQMTGMQYAMKMGDYLKKHGKDKTSDMIKKFKFRQKPRVDMDANMWISDDADYVLGLVFRETTATP